MTAYLRAISVCTLTILLWSCFGLGIGMIGHTLMQYDMGYTDINMNEGHVIHECCSGVEGGASQSDTDTRVQHHQELYAMVLKIVQFGVIAVIVFFVYRSAFSIYRSISQLERYVLFWQQHRAYFALYIRLLFGKGIVHPKTF